MGWCFTEVNFDRFSPTGFKPKDVVEDLATWENPDRKQKVLLSAQKFNVIYSALEVFNKLTNETTVEAMVTLIRMHPNAKHENFGWKCIGERAGPVEDKCPKDILELLTPTQNVEAIKWRERCWENIKKREAIKLATGDIIEFKSPVKFTNGLVESRFIIKDAKRMLLSTESNPYGAIKISSLRDRLLRGDASIIKTAPSPRKPR